MSAFVGVIPAADLRVMESSERLAREDVSTLRAAPDNALRRASPRDLASVPDGVL